MACSDPASSCPEDFWSANGTACSGNAECDYGGCALPGNWCRCEDGKWSCVHTDCYAPDLGLDSGTDSGTRDMGDDLAPDMARLGQGDPCVPSDDHCASGLRCCMTGGGPPWLFDAAPPPPYTCTSPRSDGTCPPPPP